MWTKHVKQRFSVIENQEIQGHSASERRNKQYKLHDCTILLPKERCKPWRDPSQLPEMNRCHGGGGGRRWPKVPVFQSQSTREKKAAPDICKGTPWSLHPGTDQHMCTRYIRCGKKNHSKRTKKNCEDRKG